MNDPNRTNNTHEQAEPVPARFQSVVIAVRNGVLAIDSMPNFADSHAFMPSVAAAPAAPVSNVIDFKPTPQLPDNKAFIEQSHQAEPAEVIPIDSVRKAGTDFKLPEEQQALSGEVVEGDELDQRRRINAARQAESDARSTQDVITVEEMYKNVA